MPTHSDGCYLVEFSASDGAASVIRTRDLTLTKGALYRWSYGSISIDAHGLHESGGEVKFFPVRNAGFRKKHASPTIGAEIARCGGFAG